MMGDSPVPFSDVGEVREQSSDNDDLYNYLPTSEGRHHRFRASEIPMRPSKQKRQLIIQGFIVIFFSS